MSKKALLWLLLLLFACTVGGGYWLYQYQSKSFVTDLIEQFAPVARINVADIEVDLKGNILIKGLKIAPIGYQDVVQIEQVNIVSGSALALLSADTWFKGAMPSSLRLQFSSLIFSIDSDFMRTDVQHVNAPVSEKTLWGLACTDEVNFTSIVTNLGLRRVLVDVQVNIESVNGGRVLKSNIAVSAPGLVKGLFEFELNSKAPLSFYERSVLSKTEISRALLSITDAGFNLKRLKYCAKKEEVAEADYPNYFMASVQLKMIQEQQTDSQELESSVLAFLKPRASVVLRLQPKGRLLLSQVLGSDFQLLARDDLLLSVNAKKASTRYLPLLNGRIIEQQVIEAESPVDEVEVLASLKEQVSSKREMQKSRPKYQSVELANLTEFKGRQIRLRTLLGKEIDGVLLEVKAKKIIMRRRVEQGLVTYPVLKENIASIKVFR
ncbi:MAG: hypothetical protein MJK10_04140 [Pseudomonadales bacterium]|nr:hypothetical protein [Pseudomonadales bacterium]NRA15302.1 hypothetical protein [Oceanospirillaceae bacterium]